MLIEKLNGKVVKSGNFCDTYNPVFFRICSEGRDKDDLMHLLETNTDIKVHDTITAQLKELVKTRKPSFRLSPAQIEEEIISHLNGINITEYGVWVYYPWKETLVHILDKNEFIELRTNRNKYKITDEEQETLGGKKVGIIGLSVGQSIALTFAMERICGELRLADFDTADLSNLNRLRTGVANIGIKKTVIAAREIMEMDPYLNIKLFDNGINEGNIVDFMCDGGKLDLLVEVCDGIDIKILSRYKARELGIPVIMDTNDRGMLDVERFDLEPSRPVLHGLAEGLDPNTIKGLSNEDKVPFILNLVGIDTISSRLKASMMEVEQSLSTWPQLASSVTLGGALTTDVSRRILLGLFHDSGRYYVDFDELIKNKPSETDGTDIKNYFGPDEMDRATLELIAAKYKPIGISSHIGADDLNTLLNAACLAPSGGNAQPWKFLYKNDRIFIIHDEHFSYSLLDFRNEGSYLGFGAMLENIAIAASAYNIPANVEVFPVKDDMRLIAVVSFGHVVLSHALNYLSPVIGSRVTNRNTGERKLLDKEDKLALESLAEFIPGAKLQLYEEISQLAEFANELTNAERIRILNPRGHFDTFIREIRFNRLQTEATSDGMDIETLNMSKSEKAGLQIASDPVAIEFLNKLQKGTGFKKISHKPIMTSSCIGVLSMDGNDAYHFLQGGRATEIVWLEANRRGISLQPVSAAIFLLSRYLHGNKSDFNHFEQSELNGINKNLNRLMDLPHGRYPVFIFRLFYADQPKERALRRPLKKVFFEDRF